MIDYSRKTSSPGTAPESGERRDYSGRLLCSAQGCPLSATITAGGGWLCPFHYNSTPRLWPRVTERILRPETAAARRAIRALEIADSARDIATVPRAIKAVQEAMLALGADSEDVTLLEQVDSRGKPFLEAPRAFANRMHHRLINLIAPERDTEPRRRAPINTASIVSPEKDIDADMPF